jgi:hypothetical protein
MRQGGSANPSTLLSATGVIIQSSGGNLPSGQTYLPKHGVPMVDYWMEGDFAPAIRRDPILIGRVAVSSNFRSSDTLETGATANGSVDSKSRLIQAKGRMSVPQPIEYPKRLNQQQQRIPLPS